MTLASGFRRIKDGLDRGDAFTFFMDDTPVRAYRGESIAAALLAAGRRHSRLTTRLRERRGPYCVMGVCWECVVVVDGRPNVRSCVTPAAPDMRVETQHGPGAGGDG